MRINAPSKNTSKSKDAMLLGDLIEIFYEDGNFVVHISWIQGEPLYLHISDLGASSFEMYTDRGRKTVGYQFVKYLLIAPTSSEFNSRYKDIFGHDFPKEGIIAERDDEKDHRVWIYEEWDIELENNQGFLLSANPVTSRDVLRWTRSRVISLHF